MTQFSKSGKSSKGFGSSRTDGFQTLGDYLHCNTDTTYSTKSHSIPLYVDLVACAKAYEVNPSLLFSDLETHRELNKLDPMYLPWGFNPQTAVGFWSIFRKMIENLTLSDACTKSIQALTRDYIAKNGGV